MDQHDLFSGNTGIPISIPQKALKIKNDITLLIDKHWDTGLLQEHRSIILVYELKAKGYKKEDFEEIRIPIDVQDKYDYGSLVEDILFYFNHKPIPIKDAQEVFYDKKIIPITIVTLRFINSSIRRYLHDAYMLSFAEKWRFFQGNSADEAIQKLDKFLKKYTPSNGFDQLIYDFYKQFPGLLKSGLVIKDSGGILETQEYIKNSYDKTIQEIKTKKKGSISEKNVLRKMRDTFDYDIFNGREMETKMILDGHYRNEMPGSSDWTNYQKLLLKLLVPMEDNPKSEKDHEKKQIQAACIEKIRDKLKVKYYSRLLLEERKNDG